MKKKHSKTVSKSRKFVYFIFGTLNTGLFGQVPPKSNQKHNLDLIDLLIDGSGSAKEPGSGSETLFLTLSENNT